LAQMRGLLLSPDVLAYNNAISACARGRSWEMAVAVLAGAEASGGGASADGAEALDVVSFGAALQPVARSRRWQVALQLLRGMARRRLSPNGICYTAALNALGDPDPDASDGRWRATLQLLSEMWRKQLQPEAAAAVQAV
ncbi:unnamed protein product, partial [Effrenium voratum]